MAQKRHRFTKPITSIKHQRNGEKRFYYLAHVSNYKQILIKYGLGYLSYGPLWWSQAGTVSYYTKEEIDKCPRYLRRGGEYGHDAVIVSRHDTLSEREKNIAKIHKLEMVRF